MSTIELPDPALPVTDVLSDLQQQRFLDSIVDAIPCMVFVKRASDLSYVRMNRSARETLGLTEADFVGKTDVDLFEASEAERIQQDDRSVIESKAMGPVVEETLMTLSGLRWFGTQKVPIESDGDWPPVLFTFSEDITIQRELIEKTAMWEEVFEHSERAIVVGSPEGTVLEVINGAFADLYGGTIQEMTGTPLMAIFAPEARQAALAMLALVSSRGQHTFESLCVRKDGSTFPVRVDASSVKDALGNVNHRAIRILDTTAPKAAELALQTDRNESNRANQAKSQFLSRMSHELRTPINVILEFAQVTQLDELNAIQTESIEHILSAGRHLLSLVDEALDISRVESGHLALSLQSVDLGGVIQEVLRLMKPLADQARVSLIAGSHLEECHVIADRLRLKQVLLNLVANGVNYNTAGGHVRVDCRSTDQRIEIAVSDSGIGIPADQAHRLFTPFDRLGREETPVEGTGLGLSLSRALVEAMNGSIDAAPNGPIGTVFTVRFRRAEQPEPRASFEDSPPGDWLVLYIVEDIVNFGLVEKLLERRPGVRIVPALQGSLGIQLARYHQPDLIIVDLHPPDLSGEETLRRLKSDPRTKSIPVVVASSDTSERRIERLAKLGARSVLTRPLNIQELLAAIDSELAVRSHPGPG